MGQNSSQNLFQLNWPPWSTKLNEPSANNEFNSSSLCDGELEYDAEEDAEGDDAEDDPDHDEVAGAAVQAAVAVCSKKSGGKFESEVFPPFWWAWIDSQMDLASHFEEQILT